MFSDVSQDFTLSSGRIILKAGEIGLVRTFAMFDNDSDKNDKIC